MKNHIDILREITTKLPEFPVSVEEINGFQEYQMEKGVCFGWYVFADNNGVGIHRWFNSKDTRFPIHAHPEREWIIVYDGVLVLKTKEKDIPVRVGESVYNPPNREHGAFFPEDCKYITVTIPPAKEFPNARKQ